MRPVGKGLASVAAMVAPLSIEPTYGVTALNTLSAQKQGGHAGAGRVGGITVEGIGLRKGRAYGERPGGIGSWRDAVGAAEAVIGAELGGVAPAELGPGGEPGIDHFA